MSWRVVVITNPCQLSVANNQLCIKQEDTARIPLEDIQSLLIDSYGVTITTNTLALLGEHDVTTIFCDQQHLPISTLLPHEPHSRQRKVMLQQLGLSVPFQKRLWQALIQQKIANQGAVLQLLKKPDHVSSIAPTVKSGDSDHREAYASRLYFREVLPEGITRKHPHVINAALNYGYAIIRSHLARSLVGYGFITSLGLHHKNEFNHFNLADDFIEPYRALVDYHVFTTLSLDDTHEVLTKEDRIQVIDILNHSVKINNQSHTLKYALELTVKSFSQCCTSHDYSHLLLPVLDSSHAAFYENHRDVRPSDENES